MQIVQIRRILWLIGGLASAGAIVVIVGSANLPLGSTADFATQTPSRAAAASGQASTTVPLASFESAWTMLLRRPLVDPPPVADAASGAPVKAIASGIRLIGTIVDGQHPRGVFMTGLSTVELKSISDKVGGATVISIDENSATLSIDGDSMTLHREKKPFDPSGESYDAAAPVSDAKPISE